MKTRSLLFLSSPFSRANLLLLDALSERLRNGSRLAVFVTDKSVKSFVSDAESCGYCIKKYVGKSLVIKSLSELIIGKAVFSDVKAVLAKELKSFRGGVCFSNSSVLLDLYGEEFVKEVALLKGKFDVLTVLTDWGYSRGFIDGFKSLFNDFALVGNVNNYDYCIRSGKVSFFDSLGNPVVPKVLLNKSVGMESVADELSRSLVMHRGVIDYKGVNVDVINGDFKSGIELFSDDALNPVIMMNDNDMDRAKLLIDLARSNGLSPVVCSLLNPAGLSKSLGVPVINFKDGEDVVSLVLNELIK